MGRLINAWRALFGNEPSEKRWDDTNIENPAFPITPTALSQVSVMGGESAGVRVNEWKALGYTPLYQAVSMISGDATKLPIKAYRKSQDGKRQRIDHPAQAKLDLYKMANEEVSGLKFLRRLFVSALLHNNGYAWIDWSKDGTILGVYNLLPDRTYPMRVGGKLQFVTHVGSQATILEPWEVIHLEGVSVDGLQGADIIKLFREDLAVALARRGYTARFFESGMTAGGILQAPMQAKPEAVRKVEAGVAEKFSGGKNAFKTVVLRDGYKWFSTQVNPEQAQLSEMDADQARSIARIYNLDPSRLGVPGSSSYNHDEWARKDYYDGTLSHWVLSLASEINIKMLSEQDRESGVYLEHEINALLWADAKGRSEIAQSGILSGRFSPNETRAWENLDPYDGGDDFLIPLNVGVKGAEQTQPAQPDQSARSHLEKIVRDTLERAKNRCGIKAKKGTRAIAEDAGTLMEMLVPPFALACRQDEQASELAKRWVDQVVSSDPDKWQEITDQTLEAVLG